MLEHFEDHTGIVGDKPQNVRATAGPASEQIHKY
jgi:hypothetical protein